MNHFFDGFFQLGYVTRDLDAALAAYRKRFGPLEFMFFDPPVMDGVAPPTKRLALAYMGDIMTEIIQVDTDQKTIYDDALADDPAAIQLHHLGFLIDDHQAMLDRLRSLNYEVPFHGSFGTALDYSYADTRADLGHWCEFIRLGEEGHQFFASAPRNKTR